MVDTAEEKERAQRRRWERTQPPEPEEPESLTYKLDTPLVTLADVDRRVGEWLATEREQLHELLAQLLAEMPTAERGERGPPGFLPIVKTWRHDAVFMPAMWSRLTARLGRRPRTPRRLPAPAQTGGCSLAAASKN
jgi:hypothetical protein